MPTIDISGVSHSYELFSPQEDKPVLVFIHG
ncbi:MAG: alpha/beta hydrolase, partial [Microcystis sp.]